MKKGKIITLVLIILLVFNIQAFAKDKVKRGPIFMGKIEDVQKDDKENIYKVKVKGYIKGEQVYEEEIIGIINEDTRIINDTSFDGKEKKECDKVNLNELKISKGDIVFLVLNEAMTKSIPPQVGIRAIEINSKNK